MDTLERLVSNAEELVAEGYYRAVESDRRSPSFLESLGTDDQSADVIVEIKFASPTMRSGKSAAAFDNLLAALVAVEPLGLSVLAEPRIFGGHLDFVRRAARTALPVLMKDIIVDSRQIDAAAASGASAVLVIQTLATRGFLRMPVQTLIDRAHDRDMDVVLEVHTLDEWDAATATDADVLGINNRDLSTMDVDLGTTRRLLSSRPKDRPAIAMSGIDRRDQIDEMLHAGADAVLVGTSVMASPNPARKLGELVHG